MKPRGKRASTGHRRTVTKPNMRPVKPGPSVETKLKAERAA